MAGSVGYQSSVAGCSGEVGFWGARGYRRWPTADFQDRDGRSPNRTRMELLAAHRSLFAGRVLHESTQKSPSERITAIIFSNFTGSLTAGALAMMVAAIARGQALDEALDEATALAKTHPNSAETVDALAKAQALAGTDLPAHEAVARLGEGWIAEEALAISVYCALRATDFASAVLAAVNHDGDSDSTGAITGNLLGALWGDSAIPDRWLVELELREVIAELADDLHDYPGWQIGEFGESPDNERIWAKYPGF